MTEHNPNNLPPNKPTIYRRERSSWWWVQWRVNGQRERFSGKKLGLSVDRYTEEEACQAVMEYFGYKKPITESDKSLSWLIDELHRCLPGEGIKEGTLSKYRQAIRKLIKVLGSDFPIAEVQQRPHVAEFKQQCVNDNLVPATINSLLQALQASFSKAVEYGHIESNPFDKFKRVREPDDKIRYIDEEDIIRFFDAVDSWEPDRKRWPAEYYEAIKRLMYVYIYTGKRRKEILMIRRDDIDLENMLCLIRNIKKTGEPKELCVIHPEIEEIFRWFLDTFPERQFPFAVVKADTVTRYAKLFLRAANLPDDLHLHNIRHTSATYATNTMKDIRAVQKIIGHSTVRMTERYVHGTPVKHLDIGIKLWGREKEKKD